MRESCTYGSVRGAPSNGRPYRDRREFIAMLGGAASAWPIAARAQQPAMPVIGFMSARSPADSVHLLAAFRQGLGDWGFVERQNVAVEYRWAHGDYHRLPRLAMELVDQRVAVLLGVGGDASALAAKAATSTIPVVIGTGSDPVEAGFVASLNRPGGNVTGVSVLANQMEPKRLSLLHAGRQTGWCPPESELPACRSPIARA